MATIREQHDIVVEHLTQAHALANGGNGATVTKGLFDTSTTDRASLFVAVLFNRAELDHLVTGGGDEKSYTTNSRFRVNHIARKATAPQSFADLENHLMDAVQATMDSTVGDKNKLHMNTVNGTSYVYRLFLVGTENSYRTKADGHMWRVAPVTLEVEVIDV